MTDNLEQLSDIALLRFQLTERTAWVLEQHRAAIGEDGSADRRRAGCQVPSTESVAAHFRRPAAAHNLHRQLYASTLLCAAQAPCQQKRAALRSVEMSGGLRFDCGEDRVLRQLSCVRPERHVVSCRLLCTGIRTLVRTLSGEHRGGSARHTDRA